MSFYCTFLFMKYYTDQFAKWRASFSDQYPFSSFPLNRKAELGQICFLVSAEQRRGRPGWVTQSYYMKIGLTPEVVSTMCCSMPGHPEAYYYTPELFALPRSKGSWLLYTHYKVGERRDTTSQALLYLHSCTTLRCLGCGQLSAQQTGLGRWGSQSQYNNPTASRHYRDFISCKPTIAYLNSKPESCFLAKVLLQKLTAYPCWF